MAGNTIKMKELPAVESSEVTELVGLGRNGQSVKLPNSQNELKAEVVNLRSKVGDLLQLETTDKASLVSAVNEVKNQALDLPSIVSPIQRETDYPTLSPDADEFVTFGVSLKKGDKIKFTKVGDDYDFIEIRDDSGISIFSKTPSTGSWGNWIELTRPTSYISYKGYTRFYMTQAVYTTQADINFEGIDAEIEDLRDSMPKTVTQTVIHLKAVGVYEGKDFFLTKPAAKDSVLNYAMTSGNYCVISAIYTDNTREEIVRVTVGKPSPGKELGEHKAKKDIKGFNIDTIDTEVTISETRDVLKVQESLDELSEDVGSLNRLNTSDKTSIVNAINSVNSSLPEMTDKRMNIVSGFFGDVDGKTVSNSDIKEGMHFFVGFSNDADGTFGAVIATYADGSTERLAYKAGGITSVPFGEKIAKKDIVSFKISSTSDYPIDIYYVKKVIAGATGVNYWEGKKWLAIGDSITTAGDYGVHPYAKRSYPHVIGDNLGMTVTNVALSGRTPDYFYPLIDGYDDDYDLITIMLGTNNQGYGYALGELYDEKYQAGVYNSIDSTYAAFQLLYEKIRVKYPNTPVLFITPVQRTATAADDATNNNRGEWANGAGKTCEDYAELVKRVARNYGCLCADIYNTVCPKTLEERKKWFVKADGSDGTHPNDAAHEQRIAPVIQDIIEHQLRPWK